jgi:hypothetical protein
MPALAVVAGATLVGGAMQSKAASKASKAQTAAANASLAAEERMYNQSREDLSPYRQAGYAATNALSSGLGLGTFDRNSIAEQLKTSNPSLFATTAPEGEDYTPEQNAAIDAEIGKLQSSPDYGSLSKKFTINDYQADPGYQFRLDEGNKAINAAQSARGNFYSGAALKEANKYNSNMASQEYGSAYDRWVNQQNNQFNKLQSVAGTGAGATNTQAQLNQGYAGSQGNIYGQLGSSQANTAINQGNIYSGMVSNIGGAASSYYNPYNATKRSVYSSVNNPANSAFF